MGTKVFITGAAGYLGSVLATQLAGLDEVDSITGIDTNINLRTPLPPKVTLVKMDIRSPELASAMAHHDHVIHTAFIVQWLAKMPASVRDDININGTRNVAQAAMVNKVGSFIYASSVAIYDPVRSSEQQNIDETFPIGDGTSSMYYLNSKAKAEKMLVEVLEPSGIQPTFLRMSYITGPCDQAIVKGFRENAVQFSGHDLRAQFVHEEDVARAFAQAMRTGMPGAYNVVPDDSIRLDDLYKIIGAKPMKVPIWLAHLVTYVRWRFLGSPSHPSWVDSALINSTASNAKLKATGWKPHFSSEEAIRAAL